MYYREIVHLVLVQESDFHLVWSFAPERNEDEINAHTRMKSPFRSCIEQHFYILILYINDIYIYYWIVMKSYMYIPYIII